MSNTPTAVEDIDERIEKRLSLLRDSIELKLNKEVDALLKSRFDSTGKLLGWAFGLVAVVFTGFGIKTLLDIKEIARTTAMEEVKQKLAIDDPNSDLRRDIDKIVARGLIDSYLLTIAKTKGERFRPDLNVSENDLRRLRILVADEKTSEKDFSDAIEVLLNATGRGRDDSVGRLIQAIGTGTDEKYRWIKDQPEKRAALLRLYSGDKLTQVSSSILEDDKTPEPLLIAAIKYSGSKDDQSGKLLEHLTKHRNPDLANEAALALAKVDPESSAVKGVLDKPQKSKDDGDWATAIRVAIEVATQGRRSIFNNTPMIKIATRTALAANTLRDAIRSGFVFRLSSNFGDPSMASLYVSSQKNYSRLYPVSTDIIGGSAQGAVMHLLRDASIKPDELQSIIRAFCLEDDGRCWGLVRVNLKEGGQVVLQGGIKIDSKMAPGGVTLRADGIKSDSPIVVSWTDQDAVSKRGHLIHFADAEKIDFTVRVSKALTRNDEGE